MTALKALLAFWKSHGTKVLGFAQGTIAAVAAVDGIIPAANLKYWMAALGVLTFWRGYTNSTNLKAEPNADPSA